MNMKTKMKGIPIYLIALVLIVGAVAGAGIWFLTVNIPVEYDEPVLITLYSEADTGAEYGVGVEFSLRDTYTHGQNIDMTYSTFHQYVNFSNPAGGKAGLNIDVTLTAFDGAEEQTTTLGFVIIDSSEVDPRDVTWVYDGQGNREQAIVDNVGTYPVTWGSDVLSVEDLATDTIDRWTVIYVIREFNDSGSPYFPIDFEAVNVSWEFVDVTP